MPPADDARVKHGLRGMLLALGAGVVVQRLCQLVAFVLVGHTLGAAGLGRYAEGQALGALLAVLAGAGVRNLAARQLASAPGAAGAVIRAAVRLRLAAGSLLLATVAAVAFATASEPWFWLLSAALVLPAAFDLKQLADAAGRGRGEVALETGIGVLQLGAVLVWSWQGGRDLTALAAIALACRTVYALRAWTTMRSLPATQATVTLPRRPLVLLGQTLHELLALGDVWLVAVLLGEAAAGFYAFAQRFAVAALVPSTQLARLLLPHLLHATASGDPGRTLGTALRATALVTLPMLGGGAVAAEALCTFAGADFAPAAPILRLLLLAGCLQHLGWQCSHALLACHRDRAYANGLLWPALLHATLLLATAACPVPPPAGAVLAGVAAVLASTAYLAASLHLLPAVRLGTWMLGPAGVAAATAGATMAGAAVGPGLFGLAAQLAAGGIAFVAGVWLVELRGRWRHLGDGLVRASGFHA
jgi:O-antigen/teichoic acid export membrane protein